MNYHSCRASLCETPHGEHKDECQCDMCHDWHRQNDINNFRDFCARCFDEMIYDQERSYRCPHGEIIPFIGPEGFVTDQECIKCQIDYGPGIYAFDGIWQRSLERELNHGPSY